MKYIKRPFLIFLMLTGFLLSLPVSIAFADEETAITDTQLVQVQARCSEIKSILRQLHVSDAVVRVNRGKLYERLSTRLMAPLNSRIALNRLDGTSLVAVTSEYEKHLISFRSAYQKYEETLSDLISIDCKNQPAHFYNTLEDTRTRREQVRAKIDTLAQDIANYKQAFDDFYAPYKESQ